VADLKGEQELEKEFDLAIELAREPTTLVEVDEDDEYEPDRPLIPRYKEDEGMEMEVPLRLRKMVEQRNRPKRTALYKPYFTIVISVIDVLMMIVELIVNKGFTSPKINPWLGVSLETLIILGGKDVPLIIYDQEWWRIITPVFFHVGLGHLVLNLIAQIPLGLQLERQLGSTRLIILYFGSAIAGNLFSAVFLPYQLEVGASTAIYGLGSYYFVDLVVHWSLIVSPWRYFAGLMIGTVIGLVLGLFPGVDNFAHIGGMIGGFLMSMVIVPRTKEGKSLKWARGALYSGPPLIALYLILCVVTLCVPAMREVAWECRWCRYFNCLPVFGWCDDNA